MTLSKLISGTGSGSPYPRSDFGQYNSLKYQILSGGINHIDSGHQFRWHKTELILGQLLNTLFEKYKLGRDEIFITSKQGYLDFNYQEKAHQDLVI